MLFLQASKPLNGYDSLLSWILLLGIIILVAWRLWVIFGSHLRTGRGKKTKKTAKRSEDVSPTRKFLDKYKLHHYDLYENKYGSPLYSAIVPKWIGNDLIAYFVIVALVLAGLHFFTDFSFQLIVIVAALSVLPFWTRGEAILIKYRKEEDFKYLLGGLYYLKSDRDKAFELLRQAAELKPDPYTTFILGQKLGEREYLRRAGANQFHLVDYSKPIKWLEESIHNSNYNISLQLKALFPLKREIMDYDGTMVVLEEYHEIYDSSENWNWNGEMAKTYFLWAEDLKTTGRLEEAKERIEVAIEYALEADDIIRLTKSYRMLGDLNFQLGNPKASKSNMVDVTGYYMQFLNSYSNDYWHGDSDAIGAEVVSTLATPFKALGDSKGYLSMWIEKLDEFTGESNGANNRVKEIISMLARQARQFGNIEIAEAFERRLREEYSTDLFQDNYENPEYGHQLLSKADEEYTGHEVECLLKLGLHQPIMKLLDRGSLSRVYKNEIDALRLHETFHVYRWEFSATIGVVNEILERHPNLKVDCLLSIINYLLTLGKFDEAKQNLDLLVEQVGDNLVSNPDIIARRYVLYRMFERKQDYEKAIALCQSAIEQLESTESVFLQDERKTLLEFERKQYIYENFR